MTHNTASLNRMTRKVSTNARVSTSTRAVRRANEIARTFNRIASRNAKAQRAVS